MKDTDQDRFDDSDFLDVETTEFDADFKDADLDDIPDDIDDDGDDDIGDAQSDEAFDAEEGIFASSRARQRKRISSKVLLGGVAALAILGGGILYFISSPADMNAQLATVQPPAPPPEPVEQVVPPTAANADNANPDPIAIVGQVSADGTQQIASALPVPQSDFAEAVPNGESATAPVMPDGSKSASAPDSSASPTVLDQTASATPVLPDPMANPAANASVSDAKTENAKTAAGSGVSAAQGEKFNSEAVMLEPAQALSDAPVPEAASAPVPSQAALKEPAKTTAAETANAPLTPEPDSDVQPADTSAKTAPAKEKPVVYFDAPAGKILKDLPPPSINTETEPGQSIIIVKKSPDDSSSAEGAVTRGSAVPQIESQLVSANRAASLGRYDAALDFYNQLYKQNPRDPRILMGRAVTLQKMGETQLAIDAYRQVLNVDSENPQAMTNMMGLMSKTQPAVALQNLLDLRQKYPNNEDVAAQLGVAYAQSGNPEDGYRYLNTASKLNPKNPLHYFNMGVLAEKMKMPAKAIEMYEKALDTDSVYGNGRSVPREQIYDRLARLR